MAGRNRRGPASPTTTETEYRKLLEEHRACGGTLGAFANRVGIPLHRVRWWKSELGRRDRQRASGGRTALAGTRPAKAVAFMPVRVVPDLECAEYPDVRPAPQAAVAYEVLLRGGRLVRVQGCFEPASLTALVAALEAVPC